MGYVCVKYSMCDLICDVTSCCVLKLRYQCIWWNHDWKTKKEKIWKSKKFLHKYHLKHRLRMEFTAC